ncbi:hypothetical protein [Taklimakanibacter deserti]|uniref:hypothetical protein n=1 Tax=Taklimakanibacter deserti TaxID=2267839 RepID=UPI000E65BF86
MFDPSSTRHLHIEFRNVAVENKAKSLKEGRPIYDQQEQVFIRFAGDTKKELVAPAHEKCMRDPQSNLWVSYAQVYHRHYEAFKSGEAAVGEGTPIDELPFIDSARRAELKALHVHTAEALAGLEGINLSRLGMFGRELKEKAAAYIATAKDSAHATALAARNAELSERLEALEAKERQREQDAIIREKPAVQDEPAQPPEGHENEQPPHHESRQPTHQQESPQPQQRHPKPQHHQKHRKRDRWYPNG